MGSQRIRHNIATFPHSLNNPALVALGDSVVKNPPASAGDTQVRSQGREDPPGGGHGNPLQYSCLENPMGRASLAGYSPWGHRESDTAEHTHDTPQKTLLHKDAGNGSRLFSAFVAISGYSSLT